MDSRERKNGAGALGARAALLLFLAALAARGTDDQATVERRLRDARKEFAGVDGYDFAVINDDIHRAVARVSAIICRSASCAAR